MAAPLGDEAKLVAPRHPRLRIAEIVEQGRLAVSQSAEPDRVGHHVRFGLRSPIEPEGAGHHLRTRRSPPPVQEMPAGRTATVAGSGTRSQRPRRLVRGPRFSLRGRRGRRSGNVQQCREGLRLRSAASRCRALSATATARLMSVNSGCSVSATAIRRWAPSDRWVGARHELAHQGMRKRYCRPSSDATRIRRRRPAAGSGHVTLARVRGRQGLASTSRPMTAARLTTSRPASSSRSTARPARRGASAGGPGRHRGKQAPLTWR
jgi:hypothetical protein